MMLQASLQDAFHPDPPTRHRTWRAIVGHPSRMQSMLTDTQGLRYLISFIASSVP
jgi:hypothetical protein